MFLVFRLNIGWILVALFSCQLQFLCNPILHLICISAENILIQQHCFTQLKFITIMVYSAALKHLLLEIIALRYRLEGRRFNFPCQLIFVFVFFHLPNLQSLKETRTISWDVKCSWHVSLTPSPPSVSQLYRK
jgi:hypothetical protein